MGALVTGDQQSDASDIGGIMSNIKFLLKRLQSLWQSERVHGEIADEIQFHIEEKTAENIRNGMSPQDARKEAEGRFGYMEKIREDACEVRGGGWIEAFAHD